MPLAFHHDRIAKFEQQYENARKYIVPFIEPAMTFEGRDVLEVGSGEGGVLKPFMERGARIVGVDLGAAKIEYAQETFADDIAAGRAAFTTSDVYAPEFVEQHRGRFSLVILKDTIEHIYGHEEILRLVRELLVPGGYLFVGFPPWLMPYGGHQQMANTKAGKLPYYHILPRPLYRGLLKAFGEPEDRIRILMEVYDTRLSIQKFERLADRCGYRQVRRQFYLINPIYEFKFGLTPRKQLPLLQDIPWVRDFATTTCYYLLQAE